jgi:hypothetical protein
MLKDNKILKRNKKWNAKKKWNTKKRNTRSTIYEYRTHSSWDYNTTLSPQDYLTTNCYFKTNLNI